MGKLDEVIKGLDNMANGKKAFDEDNINHPKHYELDKIECIDAMEMTQGRGAVMSFCLCNAFKYLWRHNRKNGLEDIKKAKWYLDKYIELAEKEGIPICKELRTESIKPIWADDLAESVQSMNKCFEDLFREDEIKEE